MNRIEVWRNVPGYKDYMVSNKGRIQSFKGKEPIILKPIKARDGHLYVFLYDGNGHGKKVWVHRVVLRAFKGEPPPGHESRHLDGNPSNNCLGNLAWGTRKQNSADRYIHGTMLLPHESPFTKLKPEDIRKIRELHSKGKSSRYIGGLFGTSHTTILKIVRGERWKGY